mgnify:CR=1 FL=1
MAIFGRRKDNPEARMSIGDHLREFRNRAIVAGVAILLCCIIGWHYYQNIYDFIEQPFRDYQHAHPEAHVEVDEQAVLALPSVAQVARGDDRGLRCAVDEGEVHAPEGTRGD